MNKISTLSALVALAQGQGAGTQKQETHPALNLYKCTKSGGCQSSSKSVTLDANWRWTHENTGYANCYTGNEWNK